MTHFDFDKSFADFKNQADWVGLRFYRETTAMHMIRNGKPEHNQANMDQGAMVEVLIDGHLGYAGTSDVSPTGLRAAFVKARDISTQAARYKVTEFSHEQRPPSRGSYQSPFLHRLDAASTEQILSTLLKANQALHVSDKIVSRTSLAALIDTEIQYISSNGAQWNQNFHMVATDFSVTAQDGRESQSRSDNGGLARCYQIGGEIFDEDNILRRCSVVGEEALELLAADNCPTGTMDLLLMPDQMNLQIHESIGHPLELDRILGDERNYAGWSFVKPENFGHLQYGSKLLNVVFDPTQQGEFASYAYDDVGNPAKREHLIQNGLLLRGLGSLESQKRLGLPGVANARSASWNRAPIDRMANINLVPGDQSLESLIASVEKGVLMKANRSWSIDDYRNKFQFGCEYGQLIENGRLTKTVKNPNYRGKTLQFWNSLKGVGDAGTYETYGSPYCGKGEPSQVIRVGHASPACLFSGIEIFGGVA